MTDDQRERLAKAANQIKEADRNFPTNVSQIWTFPYFTFSEFIDACDRRECAIARFAFRQESNLMDVFASAPQRFMHTTMVLATFLVPLASIVFAFVISPWFLFGVLFFIMGARASTGMYNITILEAARSSELAFCFLFYTSQINVYHLPTGQEYEWRQITEGS